MAIARQIQLSLLPAAPPTVPGWDFAAYYQAAHEVGGDFYDFVGLPGGSERWGLVIADVTGKGVPAALFMARTSTLIRNAGLQAGSPGAALRHVNRLLCEDGPSRLLLTAFYAVLDTHSGRLALANAGHCRPLLLRSGTKTAQQVVTEGLLLGVFSGAYIQEQEITMEPGDLLVLYTDGVTEAMNKDHEIFDEERLQAVVAAQAGAGAQQVVDAIVREVHAFRGDTAPWDDLTLVALRRLPEAS
jgi:sigma-B regulation protein RsbU (phosphoserine phosphatase)